MVTVCNHKIFDYVILVFILLSCGVLAMEGPDVDQDPLVSLLILHLYLLHYIDWWHLETKGERWGPLNFGDVITGNLIIFLSIFFLLTEEKDNRCINGGIHHHFHH